MNEAATQRTLERHTRYRLRAGEIGKKLRGYAKTVAGAPLTKTMLLEYADELDPPGVIVQSGAGRVKPGGGE
jgi:hypothetical protein